MAGLTGKTPATTFKDLLTVHSESESNQGLEATVKPIEDGDGLQSALQISTVDVNVNGHGSSTGLLLNGVRVTTDASELNNLSGRNFGDSSDVVTLNATQSLNNKTVDGGTFT